MKKFNTLRVRIGSAIIFGVILVLGFGWNLFSFSAVLLLMFLLSVREMQFLLHKVRLRKSKLWMHYLAAFGISAFMMLGAASFSFSNIIDGLLILGMVHHTLLFIAIFGGFFHFYQKIPSPIANALIVGLSFGAIFTYSIPFLEYDRWRVLFVLFCIWGADIGGYFVGSSIGKHKMIPGVSPNKTWEGFAGSMGMAVIVGWLLHAQVELPVSSALALASLIAITGVAGDLSASKIKRAAGVKDSGHLLPGHGGILDRIDAYLFCQPFVAYIFLYLI